MPVFLDTSYTFRIILTLVNLDFSSNTIKTNHSITSKDLIE